MTALLKWNLPKYFSYFYYEITYCTHFVCGVIISPQGIVSVVQSVRGKHLVDG